MTVSHALSPLSWVASGATFTSIHNDRERLSWALGIELLEHR
jgi:hypothetical protein